MAVLQGAATMAMLGVIWVVQLCVYPRFVELDPEKFVGAHLRHCAGIGLVVAPLMLTELFTAIFLVWADSGGWGQWLVLALTLGNFLSTACTWRYSGDDRPMKFLILATALLFSIPTYSPAAESATAPVTIEQAEKHLAEGAQLLDVRTKEEWDEGRLKGATLVTVTEEGFLEKAKAKLDPKKPVVVYCRSGTRSAKATEQLRAAGFTVHDLAGGITAWQAAGKPVVK